MKESSYELLKNARNPIKESLKYGLKIHRKDEGTFLCPGWQRGANIAIPFCFEYQIKDCLGCLLEKICGRLSISEISGSLGSIFPAKTTK